MSPRQTPSRKKGASARRRVSSAKQSADAAAQGSNLLKQRLLSLTGLVSTLQSRIDALEEYIYKE